MTLRHLLVASGLEPVEADARVADVRVSGIRLASAACEPGDVFVAIAGGRFDGHDFVRDAVRRGASAVIGELPAATFADLSVPYVRVRAAREAAARLAHARLGWPARGLRVVAVTGTNGKTSTCLVVGDLLDAVGWPAGVVGTEWRGAGPTLGALTTPEAPDLASALAHMRSAGRAAAVIEASSQGLAAGRLAGIDPAVAVFTNLSREHLEVHGTMHAYGQAKATLFRMLPRGACGVVNADDAASSVMIAAAPERRIVSFGTTTRADVRLDHARLWPWGTELHLRVRSPISGRRELLVARVPLTGLPHARNVAAAVAAVLALDVAVADIAVGLREIRPVPGRLSVYRRFDGALVVLDAAHSAAGLAEAIATARSMAATRGGRVLTVFTCAPDRDREDRPSMVDAALASDLAVGAPLRDGIDECASHVFEDLRTAIDSLDTRRVEAAPTTADAAGAVLDAAGPDDVVLLAAHDVADRLVRPDGARDDPLLSMVERWCSARGWPAPVLVPQPADQPRTTCSPSADHAPAAAMPIA